MVLQKLLNSSNKFSNPKAPNYSDHYLFTEKISRGFQLHKHITGLGIVALIQGRCRIEINENNLLLDTQSFVVVNRGSTLSIDIREKTTQPVLLYFNPTVSTLVVEQLLHKELSLPHDKQYLALSDFSLVEHIHYMNASLKNYLPLLIDLGKSCASFHALKADMLIRSILDDLIQENYAAIQASEQLEVVKKSTRVDLYQRLAQAKTWMERYYYRPITIDQLATMVLINPHHFLRLFKKAYDTTPRQFLINLRLNAAKQLLQQTDQRVSSICHSIGFTSVSSFSGLFKEREGLSPSAFRKSSWR